MEPFDTALEFTLKHEGGYSNDPNDPGGETNLGISKRAHPNVDIANLTRHDAALIYYREYWVPAGCTDEAVPIATALFDFAVNSGLHRSRATLRQVKAELPNAIPQQQAVRLCMERVRFNCELAKSPNRLQYLRGWVLRGLDCAELVATL